MKITVRQQHNFMKYALREMSEQDPFPKKLTCERCGKDMRPICIINDDEGWISLERKHVNMAEDENIWPHDCVSFAIYLCTSCGKASVEWNQA